MQNEYIVIRDIFKKLKRIYEWEKDDVAIIFCSISTTDHIQTKNKKHLFPRVPVLIDLDDLEKVKKATPNSWKITISKYSAYANASNKGRIRMHRLIADTPSNLVPDHHWHHYGLDNRKGNFLNVTEIRNLGNGKKKEDKNILIVPTIDDIIFGHEDDFVAQCEAVQRLRLFNEDKYEQMTVSGFFN